MLCEELSLRVSTLLKGFMHKKKKRKQKEKNFAAYSKNYACLPIENELQDRTAK